MAVLPETLKRTVTRIREAEMEEHGSIINGHHILHLVYKHLSTNSTMDNYYTIEDAHRVVWLGDEPAEMDELLDNWLETLEGMRNQLQEE